MMERFYIHAHCQSVDEISTVGSPEKFDIPEKLANQLKIDFGKVIPHAEEMPDHQVIYVNDHHEEMNFITRGMLNEVITDWGDKLFKVIKTHLVDEMRLKEQEYHYSLAGGTAELPNILYSLQSQLPMVATIYRPTMLGVRDSKFSSLVGAAIFAHELTLLLGSNSNTQSLEFDTGLEKMLAKNARTKDIHISSRKYTVTFFNAKEDGKHSIIKRYDCWNIKAKQ